MKAVCINGSPRDNGSSSLIINKLIEGMKVSNIHSMKYCLGNMNIEFCQGCKNCYITGKCIINDDINIIIEEIIASDIVVIVSPSYWGDITGQLKVFIDRNTPYSDTNLNINKKLIPSGKKGIAIAIRAGHNEGENSHIIDSIKHYFGHLGIELIKSISMTGVGTVDDLKKKPEYIQNAYDIGKSIAELVR